MSQKTVFALHGFLGTANDFSPLKKHLSPEFNLLAVDYMKIPELGPTTPLRQWGEKFNHWVQENYPAGEKILLGYSQGGRLALHALKANPSLWQKALIVSANPGIQDSERAARKANDKTWAERFLKEDFQEVVRAWNSQAVFNGGVQEPPRFARDFSREQLAQALTEWSVARQEDLRDFLKGAKVPISWVAGEKDAKYTEIAREMMALNSLISADIALDSGHRVLFDNPQALAEILEK